MTTNNLDTSAEPKDSISATPTKTVFAPASNPQPLDAQLLVQQNEQIAELKALIGNLGERLTAVQVVNARDAEFKAAVRSVETATAAVQRSLAPSSVPVDSGCKSLHGAAHECECGGGPCGCVSSACCTFEVWMSHVRVDHMQTTELTDTNIAPTNVMEVWMYASIDPIHNSQHRCLRP